MMTHWRRSAALWLAVLALLSGAVACSRSEGEEAGDGETSEEATTENGDGEAEKEGSDEDSNKKARKGKKDEKGEDADEEKESGVPVEVVEITRGPIESVLRYTTNLEAESAVTVYAEAARRVRQLLVEEGDQVRRGQVLLRLQDEAQRTAVERAKSQLEKVKLEFERQQRLFEQQLISEAVFNEASYDLEQAELAYRDSQRELSYTEVRAPISGTVTERHVKVGDQVSVNQELFDIVDFDSIVARVYVPEKELVRLDVGQEARIAPEATGGEMRTGAIERIAPVVDPRSGTVKVTVDVPRSESLLPGMYVSVDLVTDTLEDAVLVPKKALIYDADQVFLYRVTEDNKVERLLVQPVLEDREHIQPNNTVQAGDRVVVAGQAGLKDGSLVEVLGDEEGVADEAAEAEVEA